MAKIKPSFGFNHGFGIIMTPHRAVLTKISKKWNKSKCRDALRASK